MKIAGLNPDVEQSLPKDQWLIFYEEIIGSLPFLSIQIWSFKQCRNSQLNYIIGNITILLTLTTIQLQATVLLALAVVTALKMLQ